MNKKIYQKFWLLKLVHKLQPKLLVSPFPSWFPPIGHFPGPSHCGSFYFGILFKYYPETCLLWHGSQKWVLPQQNHCAIEQQNLHLKLMNYFPCLVQLLTETGQHCGHISYSGLNYPPPSLLSFIASAQFFLPPK